jgi:hypothetical protein
MVSREQKVQVSDTTKDDKCTEAGKQRTIVNLK